MTDTQISEYEAALANLQTQLDASELEKESMRNELYDLRFRAISKLYCPECGTEVCWHLCETGTEAFCPSKECHWSTLNE